MPLNEVSPNTDVLHLEYQKKQTFSIRIVAADSLERGTNKIPVTDPIVVALYKVIRQEQ